MNTAYVEVHIPTLLGSRKQNSQCIVEDTSGTGGLLCDFVGFWRLCGVSHVNLDENHRPSAVPVYETPGGMRLQVNRLSNY